ncbi:MAG: hypothetical protein IPL31_04150 [Saprospiraceae bacterium]|nr:hypothetical protein [Saprospiraceae bacterium]
MYLQIYPGRLIAPSANIPNALRCQFSALTGANFDSISSAAVKTTYVGALVQQIGQNVGASGILKMQITAKV